MGIFGWLFGKKSINVVDNNQVVASLPNEHKLKRMQRSLEDLVTVCAMVPPKEDKDLQERYQAVLHFLRIVIKERKEINHELENIKLNFARLDIPRFKSEDLQHFLDNIINAANGLPKKTNHTKFHELTNTLYINAHILYVIIEQAIAKL